MVPVIRNVEGMNFADIEKAISLLGDKVILCNFFCLFITSTIFYYFILSFRGDTFADVTFTFNTVMRL